MQQMAGNSHTNSMSGILESLINEIDGERVSIEQIVDHLKYRGYGPILAILGLLVVIIGAIPLFPAIFGFIISFISLQMLIGKEYPWIPRKLINLSISKDKLAHCINFTSPYTKKIERVLHTRYTFLFNRISEIITALTCLVLACTMIMVGFVPMLPAACALPIILFGLGYIAQDGLFVLLGFLLIFGIAWMWFF